MRKLRSRMVGCLALASVGLALPGDAQADYGMQLLVVGETSTGNRWMQQFDEAGAPVAAQAWTLPALPTGVRCQDAVSLIGDRDRFALSCATATGHIIQQYARVAGAWVPDTLPSGLPAQLILPVTGGLSYRGLMGYYDTATGVSRFEMIQRSGISAAPINQVINVTASNAPGIPTITPLSTGTNFTGVFDNIRVLDAEATFSTGQTEGLMFLGSQAGVGAVGRFLPRLPGPPPATGMAGYTYDTTGTGPGATMGLVINRDLPNYAPSPAQPLFDRFTWLDQPGALDSYDCGLYPGTPAAGGTPAGPLVLGCAYPEDAQMILGPNVAVTIPSTTDPTPSVDPMNAAIINYATNFAAPGWAQVIPISAPAPLYAFAPPPGPGQTQACDFNPVTPGVDDVLLLSRLSVGFSVPLSPPSTMAHVLDGCDCNNNGAIDVLDVLNRARIIAGLMPVPAGTTC